MEHWKKMKEELVYDGWRKVIRRYFLLPNGKEEAFDIIGSNNYVIIAAFTENHDAILVQQYRPGAEEVLVSFPEGGIEEAESLAEAARRELLEETGYSAGEVQLLKSFRRAYSNQQYHTFIATHCKKIGDQQLDDSEFIEVFTKPLTEFRSLIKDAHDHSFHNVGSAYLALDFLDKL